MQTTIFILGFLMFVGLVLVHELGHFWAARRNGVVVKEFGLGFPPRAWSKKLKSGLVLSLNWLPLGGFVRLKGEHDADRSPGSFGAAPLAAKVKIMLAGVSLNLLLAVLLFMILAVVGMPKLIDHQFQIKGDAKVAHTQVIAGYIQPASPARAANLSSYDVIEKIASAGDSRTINSLTDLRAATSFFAGQTVQLMIKHGGQQLTKQVHLLDKQTVQASQNTADPRGYLGVESTELQITKATWSAPIVALGLSKQLAILTLQGLWHAFSGLSSTVAGLLTANHQARQNGQAKASSQVGGPVAIVAALWHSGSLGLNFLLMLIAVISLTLALFNALPIPALDGGRLLLTLIFRSLRRPMSKTTEELIHGLGMVLILGLIVLVTIVDVKRFF